MRTDMRDSIDTAVGFVRWEVLVLSVIMAGRSRLADPSLRTLAEEFVLLFVFSMLLGSGLRVLYAG